MTGVLCLALSAGFAQGQPLLDPTSHPKFVTPMPAPARIDATSFLVPPGEELSRRPVLTPPRFNMEMRETTQWLGLYGPGGEQVMTTVWGYGKNGQGVTYPGPTILAMKDVPIDIRWANRLPRYNYPDGPGAHLLPVDPTLHMAHSMGSGVPAVTHLHGGHTESASDGLPEAWFTQNFQETGPHFVKKTYHYDNDQEAATLWYHDHALGITRLNVYAGLAGFYLLRDPNEMGLIKNGVLPAGPYEREIAIQDRMFTEDGALFYPSTDPDIEPGFDPLPEGPSAIAEFFGDFIIVNSVTWPKLDVEPRKYRLRMLNGSDSRFYVLEFHDALMGGTVQTFLQIGTDDGFLPHPVQLTRLLLAPGERADLIVDFSGQSEVYLLNFGPDDPFKGFNPDGTLADGDGGALDPADPATTGRLVKFAVTLPFDNTVPQSTVVAATSLRPAIAPLTPTGATRQLVLFEGRDNYGRLQPLLGTLNEGSLAWFEPITENPMVNDVEIWEVYNATEDAHPIHLHLVAFQILNRESFAGEVSEKEQPQHNGAEGVGGLLSDVVLGGDSAGPAANEAGWKDTAVMLPGQVTRVVARFDREGRYVWHCHILSHEDHEMMRPYYVGPMPDDIVYTMPEPSAAHPTEVALGQNIPNPFNPTTRISFSLVENAGVELAIYNVAGQRVRSLVNSVYPSGDHVVEWDGRDERGNGVTSGVYFYRLKTGELEITRKMMMIK
jgi:spore coat protein A